MKSGYISRRSSAGKWIDSTGWIIFVLWGVVVFLLDPFPDGIESLGIGAIVLGVAVLRFLCGVSISNFWIVIGVVFIGAGIGTLSGIDLPFFAIALMVCGILMLTHGWARRH